MFHVYVSKWKYVFLCVEYTGLVDGFKVFHFTSYIVYTLGETYAGIAAVIIECTKLLLLMIFFGFLFTAGKD